MRRLLYALMLTIIVAVVAFMEPVRSSRPMAFNCDSPLIAGHTPLGADPTLWCEDSKPMLDVHVVSASQAGRACDIDGHSLLLGHEGE